MSHSAHVGTVHRSMLGILLACFALLPPVAMGCIAGPFDNQAKREEKLCKDPSNLDEIQPSLDSYEDRGIALAYDRLVPRPNPRKGVDVDYSKEVYKDPAMLEQLYFDASEGNERARWLVCIYEVATRWMGRKAARHLMSLKCQTVMNCSVDFEAMPLSRDTESGVRLMEMMSDSFENSATLLGAEQELLGYGLSLFVGVKLFNASAVTTRGSLPAGHTRQPGSGTGGTTRPGTTVSPSNASGTAVTSEGSARSTLSSSTAAVRRGGAAPVRTGQRGEAAVRARYDIGDKRMIRVNGRNRIPDGIKDKILSEVKNVKKLSFSKQLRDFADFCTEHGFDFHLYIRTDTTLTAPLEAAIRRGIIQLRFIP